MKSKMEEKMEDIIAKDPERDAVRRALQPPREEKGAGHYVDCDAHVQEKPDTWTRRMSEKKWGDNIPHLVDRNGGQTWLIGGEVIGRDTPSNCCALFPDHLSEPTRWDEIPEGVYDPHERMKLMDSQGIDAAILYPNVPTGPTGENFRKLDREFQLDCVQAYNDYLVEEWHEVAPDRFAPLVLLPYGDMEVMVGEVARSVKRGHRGVIVLAVRDLPHLADPYWNPLWSVIQELDVNVNYHPGAGGGSKSLNLDMPAGVDHRRAMGGTVGSHFSGIAQDFANLLISGVPDKYPNIRFVAAESGLGWVPFVLEAADWNWERYHLEEEGVLRKPSQIFQDQCFINFWYERHGLENYKDVIGIDKIMWETDFPHQTSLYPDTEKFVSYVFSCVSAEDKKKILTDTPRKVYGLGPNGG